MARRQIRACSTLMELRPSMSVAQPQWKPAGQLVAYMRADSRMTSGGDPGDLRDPLGRVLGGPRAQLVEAEGPLLDESPVVEPLLDDHVDPGHEEGRVGARPQLHPDVGEPAGLGLAGIDDDELEVALAAMPLLEPLEVERRRVAEVAAVDAPGT